MVKGLNKMTFKLEAFHRVSEADLERAAAMWTRAFYDGAFYVWVMPDPAIRKELLKELFKLRLRLGILFGEVYVTPDFEGGAHWMPSENAALSEERLIEAGALEFSARLEAAEPEAMPRIQRYLEIVEPLHAQLAPFTHLYLSSIAVDPVHQKKGYGTGLLRAMFKRIDQEKMPVYLETNAEDNISYYERVGFAVRKQVIIPDTDLPVWVMIRGAKSNRAPKRSVP
ncbi:MAG: GNAT family N-acetyltransferase [Pseudomonadota bacterium]